jgi:hypothetical protein
VVGAAPALGGLIEVFAGAVADGAERLIGRGSAPTVTSSGEVVYVKDGGGIVAVPLAGGEERALATPPGNVMYMRASSIDGAIHARVAHDNFEEGWRIPLDGKPPEKEDCFTEPLAGGWRFFSSCVTGHMFVVPSGEDMHGPHARQLPSDAHPAVAADGTLVIYLPDRGDIVREDPATGVDTLLQHTPDEIQRIAPSPDGHTLFYTKYVGNVRRMLITNFGDHAR